MAVRDQQQGSLQDEILDVYTQCWDSSGRQKILWKTIDLQIS